MSQLAMPDNARWSTARGVGCVVLLFAAILVGMGQPVQPSASFIALLVGLALYPGLVGIVAARSRSSDAVITVATLLASLLFVLVASQLMLTPWGFAGRRVIAIVTGLCLLSAGTLFGTIIAAARVARPGGVRREVASIGVGLIGVVLIAVPWILFVLAIRYS